MKLSTVKAINIYLCLYDHYGDIRPSRFPHIGGTFSLQICNNFVHLHSCRDIQRI